MIPKQRDECQRIWPEMPDLFDTAGSGPYKGSRMFHSPGAIAFGPLPFLGLSLTVRWYGILMASAMALGLWLAYREPWRRAGWSPPRRRLRAVARIAGHHLSGYRRAEPGAGAGHRPVGQFLQRGG